MRGRTPLARDFNGAELKNLGRSGQDTIVGLFPPSSEDAEGSPPMPGDQEVEKERRVASAEAMAPARGGNRGPLPAKHRLKTGPPGSRSPHCPMTSHSREQRGSTEP